MEPKPATPALARSIPDSDIDGDAAWVVQRLDRSGFQAYLVGGCVRDLLLGIAPKDFDVATSARPRQVKRLFRNSRIIGRRFRLVHVHFGQRVIEVATFRAPPGEGTEDAEEGGDDLLIHRDNVFGSAEQDAFRRDFTVNALFYELGPRRVIDHVGGLPDLEARVLRTIGDAEVRLREDPVRILRAARFAGRLGFALAPDLREAARRHAGDLAKSAPPRVLEEIYRLLSGPGAVAAVRLLDELSALAVLLPEICPPPEPLYRSLARLEEWGRGDRERVKQWLMVAVLVSERAKAALREEARHDPESVVQDAIKPVLDRLTAARRDQAHARQCLAALGRFGEAPQSRAAKRLLERDWFEDALLLRQIVGGPGGDGEEIHPAWLGTEGAPTGAERPRRRRRRRGRRRRGGGPPPAGGQGS